MKTQEEIKQLANEFSKDYIKTTNNSILQSSFKLEVGYIKGYTQCQEDMADISKVTRVEVIDEYGRRYTKHNCKVELSYQDDGRTLKVFINSLNKQDNETQDK
jgi:hypothetical protein